MARNPMPTPMTAAAMPAAMAAPSGGGGGMAAMESAPAGAADTLGFATGEGTGKHTRDVQHGTLRP